MSQKPVATPRPLGNLWPQDLSVSEVMALKSLGAGVASADQQKMALETIVTRFCGYYELTFHEESDRLSAFGEGRRYVGAMIQEVLQTTGTPEQQETKT